MKRTLENSDSPPAKALKTEISLSPEQKEAIEEKRMAALAKLASKASPTNMGSSWKTALAAEFNKDYFKKVRVAFLYLMEIVIVVQLFWYVNKDDEGRIV